MFTIMNKFNGIIFPLLKSKQCLLNLTQTLMFNRFPQSKLMSTILQFPSPGTTLCKGQLYYTYNSKLFMHRTFCKSSLSYQSERSNQYGNPQKRLMNVPQEIYPSVLKSLRKIFISFLIRSYFDSHFTRDIFSKGAIQAVVTVSNYIQSKNFEDLKELATPEVISEVQQNMESLDEKYKQCIAVKEEDIYLSFVSQVGVIYDDLLGKKFVEATLVLHSIRGRAKINFDSISLGNVIEEVDKNRESIFVSNYRFIREYTKGVEDQWKVNQLNHFPMYDAD